MPEKHEVMLWAAIGQKYSNGYTFSKLLAPNVKYLRGDLIVESPFQLIWKSYGKRVVIEVIGSNLTQLITVSLSQFGQVALLPASFITDPKVSMMFVRDDNMILAIVHRMPRYITATIGSTVDLGGAGFDPFFDRELWLSSTSQISCKHVQTPLADAILCPKLFNGIGNWMRSEILHASGLKPFDDFHSIWSAANTRLALITAMDTVYKRVADILVDGIDLTSRDQQHAFQATLTVYGKQKRVAYSKKGRSSWSKSLWVANDNNLSDLGTLSSQYKIEARRKTIVAVGPWEGWEESMLKFYEPISTDAKHWHLLKHVGQTPKRGRPKKIKQAIGRPRIDRLPVLSNYDAPIEKVKRSQLSLLHVALPPKKLEHKLKNKSKRSTNTNNNNK